MIIISNQQTQDQQLLQQAGLLTRDHRPDARPLGDRNRDEAAPSESALVPLGLGSALDRAELPTQAIVDLRILTIQSPQVTHRENLTACGSGVMIMPLTPKLVLAGLPTFTLKLNGEFVENMSQRGRDES